jgi:hypothetical protein
MARSTMRGANPTRPKDYKVPTDTDGLVQWLESKRESGKALSPENQMKLNLAFVLGYQWVVWDPRSRAYRRVTINQDDPNKPVRLSANKIGGFVERTIAKLTKNVPGPEARPVSDNDNDIATAKVGTRILAHELDRLQWNSRLQKFLFWPASIGWGYLHVRWDPTAGDKVGTDPDDENEAVFAGDIVAELVAPFELKVDPNAVESLPSADAKWCIRTTTMTCEGAWERYGIMLEAEGGGRSLAQEVHALGTIGESESSSLNTDWVNVHQLWMKPCRAAPEGCVITWSGTQIIEKKMRYPYDHGELPFVQCNFLPGIGTREGRTPVTDMIPSQTDYNDALSREATIRRQLVPKFIGAVGQIDPQRITSRVETLLYMPGVSANPPAYEGVDAAWAQQFEMGMNRDLADMGERIGIGEASSGQSASSAAAATTLALQEADETKLALTATEVSTFIAAVGRQILLLARQYWDEERTIRVWSDEDVIQAYRYTGGDIDERLDVHVSSEAMLPRSKTARTQLLMELQARFPDLIDPQLLMSLIDLPGTDLMTKALDIHTRKATRENGQLLRGEQPAVKPYDNHLIHLKVINDFRCSIDFENLEQEDQARFDAHAAVHEMLVLKQLGVAIPAPEPTQNPEALAQAQQASLGAAGQDLVPPSAGGGGQPPAPQQLQGQQANDTAFAKGAGIGGAGNPGRVPGISLESEAHLLGR